MTIHLASWLVWTLAIIGYAGVGVLCCTFVSLGTMDAGGPLIYLMRFLALVAWPVMIALLIVWCLILFFARMVFE
jgi:hypothetical protein